MKNQSDRSRIHQALDEMLAPYQIDIEDLKEYPFGIIDGAPWYVYFCVPSKIQFELFAKYNLSGLAWLETPTEHLNSGVLKARLKDPLLITNRLTIINDAYGEYYKNDITMLTEWDAWNELRASISDSARGKDTSNIQF